MLPYIVSNSYPKYSMLHYLIAIIQTQIYMKLVNPFTIKINNHSNFVEYFTMKQMFFLYQPISHKPSSLYKIHN